MAARSQFAAAVLMGLVISGVHAVEVIAQESDLTAQELYVEAATPANAPAVTQGDDAPSVAEALRPTRTETDLLLVPASSALSIEDNELVVGPTVVQSGGKTGLGFMIAGGAALVAGLLIGGTSGDIIAVGGAVLGVWGIIVYF